MERTIERLPGDTHGIAYELTVLRFAGSDPAAPRAYLQAALHGGEMPGVAAIDALMPMLAKAEAEGRVRGAITVVPWANPVGRATYVFGDLQGRFAIDSRTNFNRDYPAAGDAAAPDLRPVDVRLKALLLGLSAGHEIVLDLHCDDEGLAYLYVPGRLWPHMADCAAAMGVEAVVLWDGESGRSFDEASFDRLVAEGRDPSRMVVTTAEYRGVLDVDRDLAERDAAGLYRLLAARGVVADDTLARPAGFTGAVAPIDHVEMMPSPVSGVVLYDVKPGDRVARGQRLATILNQPGERGGSVDVFAPQAGFILTRRCTRQVRAGDDLMKLVGDAPSANARAGALEA
ncbi:MAG: succinylglutamate desuccinylase/aspartoacylase family protein [Rhizobiaceae bacterium]|nr:succinylglutamate desuccinylase/aspartoacylase family protein [Rhizobiaceae bacterium]